jgi:hypothetical protein
MLGQQSTVGGLDAGLRFLARRLPPAGGDLIPAAARGEQTPGPCVFPRAKRLKAGPANVPPAVPCRAVVLLRRVVVELGRNPADLDRIALGYCCVTCRFMIQARRSLSSRGAGSQAIRVGLSLRCCRLGWLIFRASSSSVRCWFDIGVRARRGHVQTGGFGRIFLFLVFPVF